MRHVPIFSLFRYLSFVQVSVKTRRWGLTLNEASSHLKAGVILGRPVSRPAEEKKSLWCHKTSQNWNLSPALFWTSVKKGMFSVQISPEIKRLLKMLPPLTGQKKQRKVIKSPKQRHYFSEVIFSAHACVRLTDCYIYFLGLGGVHKLYFSTQNCKLDFDCSIVCRITWNSVNYENIF